MILTRRSFLHASLMAGGLVVVPKFGKWFQRVREPLIESPYAERVRVLLTDGSGWSQEVDATHNGSGVYTFSPPPDRYYTGMLMMFSPVFVGTRVL